MNLRFLGDAYDYWKGSLLQGLQRSESLVGLSVDAMVTEPPTWQDEDWPLYAGLLNVPRARVVSHRSSLAVNRPRYFQEIPVRGDLFLDPDTGVATGRVKQRERYVYPTELTKLLVGSRIVVVYQHSSRTQISERVKVVVDAIQAALPSVAWVSYEATTAAMLFFSESPRRIQALADALDMRLGRHAPRRIRRSHSKTT